jgi:hypothetical protein
MNSKAKIAIAATAACAALGTPVYLQQREISILKEENAALRTAVEHAKSPAAPRQARQDTGDARPAESEISAAGEPAAPGKVSASFRPPARIRGAAETSARTDDAEARRRAEAKDAIKRIQGGLVSGDAGGGLVAYEGDHLLGAGAPPLVAGKLHWDHGQATGPPDTKEAGDIPTAWAPLNPRSGEQWLGLEYDKAVEIAEINIHETHNPGAVSRVTALMPDGKEKVLWQGTAGPVQEGEDSLETTLPVPPGTTASQIKVYVDTNRVQSWPEIDAVELVGTNGIRQWASKSSASSSYSQRYGDASVLITPSTIGSGAGPATGTAR